MVTLRIIEQFFISKISLKILEHKNNTFIIQIIKITTLLYKL